MTYLPLPAHVLHGGDYNPEQWEESPEIVLHDIALMKQARVNVVSIGIFAWSRLEPAEGVYDFAWLDQLFSQLHAADIGIILATPSGGKPNWLAEKYPEVRRCQAHGAREHQAGRHNHCLSSPVFRTRIGALNSQLAQRYGQHPALRMWHISNELSGECFCDLCLTGFRSWLKLRHGSIEGVNRAWWGRFWNRWFDTFEQITFPAEGSLPGQFLDWKRFTSDLYVDYIRHEAAPLRSGSDRPITSNFMGVQHWQQDHRRMAEPLDVVSWDRYPAWHMNPAGDAAEACRFSFDDDLYRMIKPGRPWYMMESAPSAVNWMPVCRAKRPGMHATSCLHALAGGSDMVGYFQWRKGRGGCEVHHGAVVDHVGHGNTRIFRDVSAVGETLSTLSRIVGSTSPSTVAIIYDWDSRWAFESIGGPRNSDKHYHETCLAWYGACWRRSISTAVIDSADDFTGYGVVVAPMLQLLKPGVAARLRRFVEAGGTVIATYQSGLINQDGLAFTDGFPGDGLRALFGIWAEECDVFTSLDVQDLHGHGGGLSGAYAVRHYADVLHLEGATALATYGCDYYAGTPAVTCHQVGLGKAIYVGARADDRLGDDIIASVSTGVSADLPQPPPLGVWARQRHGKNGRFLFVMNFTALPQRVFLGSGWRAPNGSCTEMISLPPWGSLVFNA